ncbi:MAG: SDR family oxidoreductase [Pseudomonadota bacterium]
MPSVLITGANRGIGLEFVRQYAKDGWRVIACCRRPDVANELHAITGDLHIEGLDVAVPDAVRRLGSSIIDPLDIVVANAGIGGKDAGGLGDNNYEIWKEVLAVNLIGVVATFDAFLPQLRAAKGKFAAISSNLGSIERANGYAPAYSTSKAALNMAIKALAVAAEPTGVAAAPFHPGWVRTDMGGVDAAISTAQSVSGLRARIAEMKPNLSPVLTGYDGEVIPW